MSKNIFIVTAHPSSKGFTHQIAAAYKKGHEAIGNTVEIMDLYKTDLKQGYLTYEDRSDLKQPDPIRSAIQEKITAADEIVFVHPMWWISVPAIMKNFIDNNISAGYAFRYVNGRPVGLLKGKSSRVFITCDGSFFLYSLIAMPFWTIWRFGILGLCGLKVHGPHVFFQKFKKTEEQKQAFLNKVEKLARQ